MKFRSMQNGAPYRVNVFLLCFLLCSPAYAAADVSVALNLDRSEALLTDTIRMVVSISGVRTRDAEPVLYGLENFTVAKGGVSSRVEMINGMTEASVDYTYFIQAQNVGTFRIGPAEVTIDGRTLRSDSVELSVKKPSWDNGSDKGPLFIKAEISSQDVYVDEIAIYTLKLYRQTRVANISLDLPKVDQVAFKKLSEPREYGSRFGGRAYQVLEIRYALLPPKAGTYVVGPSRMNMVVAQPDNRSPFDRLLNDPFFSFSSGRPATLATEMLELRVHPLPQEGRPPDFGGLVGDFRISSKLEPGSIKSGESATLTIEVSGRGNADRIPDLKAPELEHVKTYSDQPVLQVVRDQEGLGGTKVMKWALVPEKAGSVEIPPFQLSFFNPKTGTYTALTTSRHTLLILPGNELAPASATAPGESKTGAVKREVKEIGKDILPIHTATSELSVSYRPLPEGWRFWLTLIGPLAAYLTAFCALKLRRRSSEALVQVKSRKAAKDLMKRCRRTGMSHADLINAVRDYLNTRFRLSIGVLTSEETLRILLPKGVSAGAAGALQSFLHKLERAVYTGHGHKTADANQELPAIIKRIEKEIR